MEPLKQKVQVQPDNVVSTFAGLRRAAESYTGSVEGATGKTNTLLGRIKNLATSGKAWLVGTLAVGVAAVTAAIVKATGMAVEFENQLNETRKTAELNNREFGKLQSNLLDIQGELGTSREELASISAQAGRLGIKGVDDITAFTRTVALMSEATAATADQSAQSLAKVLNAFNMNIERVEALGSVFNTLSNNTVATAGDVADATRRIGAAGAMLGITADEAAALGATLIDAGFRVEKAGTRMRIIMTRIQSKADEVGQVMDMTGEQVIETFKKDGVDALQTFLDKLDELSTAQRASVVRDIFGVRDVQTIQTLIDNSEDLNRNLEFGKEQVAEATSLEKEMAITTKDVSNEWGRLTAKLSSWMTDFGSNFTSMLEGALSMLNDLFGGVREITRDLSDAQRQVESVAGSQEMLQKLQQAEQGTARFNELVKQLAENVPDAFVKFDEQGEAVGIRIEALNARLERMRDNVESTLGEERTTAVRRLNQAMTSLQKQQLELEQMDPQTEEWVQQQEQIQKTEDRVEQLVQSIGSTLPENIEKARKEFGRILENTPLADPHGTFVDGTFFEVQGLQGQVDSFFQRLQQLRGRSAGGGGGSGAGGGSGGGSGDGSGLPDEQLSRAKKAAENLDSILTEVQRSQRERNALTKEQSRKLKEIFDTRDRIEQLVERRRSLEAEAAGATGKRKQRFLDMVSQADNLIERERTRLEILKQELSTRRQELQTAEEVDPAPRERSDQAVRAAESFADRLQARVNALADRTGSEDFLRTLGVDLEAFNQKFDELEQQFANQEITQSQFYERARQLADEYKGAIGGVINQMQELGLVSFTQADAIRKGMEESRTRVDDLKRSLRQAVSAAEDSGDISTSTATEVVTALKKVDNSVLEGVTSVEGLIQRLVEMGEVSQDAAEETQEGMEDSEEAVQDLGEALQDSARLVRGIGDLASQFGDLSDEAEAAIDGTATVLDNVGRLVELSNQNEGFSNIFSSFSGAVSGLTGILGAAGGIASMLGGLFSESDEGPDFNELARKIDDNVDALKENTRALLEEGQIGEDVSEQALGEAEGLLEELKSAVESLNLNQVDALIEELEDFDFIPDKFTQLREDLKDSIFEAISVGEYGKAPKISQKVLELITGQIDPGQFREQLDQMLETLSKSELDKIMAQIGDDFRGMGAIVSQLQENLGGFSNSVSGAIERLERLRQFSDTEMGANFESFLDSLISQTEGNLKTALEDASELDIETEEGRQALSDIITQISDQLVGGQLDLGELSPNEVEKILEELQSFTERSDQQGDQQFSTQASVSRTITEHQANQLLSYQQELVQLGRSQLDELENALPFPFPLESSSPGEGEPPPQTELEGQSLSPDVFSDLSALMSALQSNQSAEVDGSQAILAETIEMDLKVYAEETPEEVARKLDRAIRNHLRRRSQ
jgi:TP901 family phage tail tape measure protein